MSDGDVEELVEGNREELTTEEMKELAKEKHPFQAGVIKR